MNHRIKRIALLLGIVAALGCEGPANEAAPVSLIASTDQARQVVDVQSVDCEQVGTVTLQNLVKPGAPSENPLAGNEDFLDVRLTSYRVTYRRTDGGTLTPAPLVRSLSSIIPANTQATIPLRLPVQGGAAPIGSLLILEPNALNQAPFAALRSSNGGVDPETGNRNVTMDAIIDFFGETLSGEEVAARTRMGLTFCLGCGGCA